MNNQSVSSELLKIAKLLTSSDEIFYDAKGTGDDLGEIIDSITTIRRKLKKIENIVPSYKNHELTNKFNDVKTLADELNKAMSKLIVVPITKNETI